MVYRYSGDGIVRGVPSSVTPTVTVVVSPSTVTPTVTVTPSWDSSNVWDMRVEVSNNSEDFDVKYATVTATGFYPQEVSSSEFTGFDVTMTEVPDYVSNLSDGANDYPIKAKVVADTNSGYDVKMWTGTKAEYDAIVTKDADTLYNITDDNTADAYEAYTKSEVDTLLSNRADLSLSNVNDTGKILMSSMGMPSGTYVDLTLGASGTSYTAPANGWLYIAKQAGTTPNVFVSIESAKGSVRCVNGSLNAGLYAFLPMAKGNSANVYYSATGTTIFFRFIYAKGSESEAS